MTTVLAGAALLRELLPPPLPLFYGPDGPTEVSGWTDLIHMHHGALLVLVSS